MTTFDDREKTFERKFALDQDLKFRAESRRNRLLAEWAAAKLGIAGDQLPDYVRSVVKADLEEKGDEDVFRKLHNDFAAAGVKVSDDRAAHPDGRFAGQSRGRHRDGREGLTVSPRGRPRNLPKRKSPSGQGP